MIRSATAFLRACRNFSPFFTKAVFERKKFAGYLGCSKLITLFRAPLFSSRIWYFRCLALCNISCTCQKSLTRFVAVSDDSKLSSSFFFGLPPFSNVRLFTWTCDDFAPFWVRLILWTLFGVTIYMDSLCLTLIIIHFLIFTGITETI